MSELNNGADASDAKPGKHNDTHGWEAVSQWVNDQSSQSPAGGSSSNLDDQRGSGGKPPEGPSDNLPDFGIDMDDDNDEQGGGGGQTAHEGQCTDDARQGGEGQKAKQQGQESTHGGQEPQGEGQKAKPGAQSAHEDEQAGGEAQGHKVTPKK